MSKIREKVPEPFISNSPLFAFIDPFGATGVSFESITAILNSPCSEILLNFDADGLARILKAGLAAGAEAILSCAFGNDQWRSAINNSVSLDEQSRLLYEAYKKRLKTLPGVNYVFETEMRSIGTTLNYFLVFASKHPLGLVKMKEVMKKVCQDRSYTFSDGSIGQSGLFRFDEPQLYAENFLKRFRGRTVLYNDKDDELTTYALNETPFGDAKGMLKLLEEANLISVTRSKAGRRIGTSTYKVEAIEFHGKGDLQGSLSL